MKEINHKLILGSGSPRRSELMQKAGFEFQLKPISIDESYPENLPIPKIAEHIAINKAQAHKDSIKEGELVLTADTIVVFEGKVYGKPSDAQNAFSALTLFSDQMHEVYTGVCLMSTSKQISFTELSEVKFGVVTEEEIKNYIKEASPMDKAGSYGIQDWIGFTRIEWIKGSYTNILGLPMAQTYDAINRF